MSYQLTEIAQYGVELRHPEALEVYLDISEEQFQKERAGESEDIYEDWERSYVGDWLDIEQEYEDAEDEVEFFGKYTFSQRLVPRDRLVLEPSYVRHGVQCYRSRYHSDFRCEDEESRGQGYFRADRELHYFGIYLGSNGYGYLDDLHKLTHPVAALAVRNFEEFCLPALLRRGITRAPGVHRFWQIW